MKRPVEVPQGTSGKIASHDTTLRGQFEIQNKKKKEDSNEWL